MACAGDIEEGSLAWVLGIGKAGWGDLGSVLWGRAIEIRVEDNGLRSRCDAMVGR